MKVSMYIILIFLSGHLIAQPNCEAFKHYGDLLKYEACKAAEQRNGHYQFSRRYQEAVDKALLIDSTFAYAYRIKSTAYLKSGDFISWKKLIDKAVKYDPENELFYRASCRFQFFRDYRGAIQDIELLDSLIDYDIGYSQNGDYHLNIIKALSYKAIDNPTKSLSIFHQLLQDSSYSEGLYDYLHLGVLNLEMGNYAQAIKSLNKQELRNDLAENRYYIALAYKQIGNHDKYLKNLKIAKEKYKSGSRMFDRYVENMDQIYLLEIENELNTSSNK